MQVEVELAPEEADAICAEKSDAHQGEAADAKDIEELMRIVMAAACERALADAEPSPAAEPMLAADKQLEQGQPFAFTITYIPSLRMQLGRIPRMKLKSPGIVVGEAEVDKQLEMIMSENPLMKGRVPMPQITAGASADLYIRAMRDGKVYPGLTGQRSYRLGEGFMPEDFDQALIGLKAGQQTAFSIDVAESDDEDAPTFPVDLEITVVSAYKDDVSQLDDAWASENFEGVKSMAELRSLLKSDMQNYVDIQTKQMLIDQAAGQLAHELVGDVPEGYVAELAKADLDSLKKMLVEQGMSMKGYLDSQGTSIETLEMNVLLETCDRVRQNAALDALAKMLGVNPSEEDVDDYLEFLAGVATSEEQYNSVAAQRNSIAVRESVKRYLAAEHLLDTAQIAA